ncbi:hypothetical protein ABQE62_31410 [Mycolicibacterium fortuitum]
MQTIVADVELDCAGGNVTVAILPPGAVPLRVAAYRQIDPDRDVWNATPVEVTVYTDGQLAVSGDPGPARVFVAASTAE